MGGGDLNAKKAWHPNTIKNQERVWKAEQAAAEEKKRIVELERERQLERDRASLNKLARSNVGPSSAGNDDRLHWMYEKPDKKVQQEEYLLGKAIDKNESVGKSEVDEIPAISRRVIGSSMLTISGDTQVDLARKMREDPLLLVKERERAARAALLNNPVQRARLTELLRKERKEQESKKEGKQKKNKKSKDLDNMLAEKLKSLRGNEGIDLASLLASDDLSLDCSDTKAKDKKKKKKSKKKAKKKKDSSSDSDSESEEKEKTKVSKKEFKKQNNDKKRKTINESEDESCSKKKKRSKSVTKRKYPSNYDSSDHQSSDEQSRDKRSSKTGNYHSQRGDGATREERQLKDERNFKSDRHTKNYRYQRDDRSPKVDRLAKCDRKIRDNKHNEEWPRDDGTRENYKNDRKKEHNYKQDVVSSNKKERRVEKHSGLSEEEKAAKLAEMAAAGIEREKQRERRVAQQLREKDKADRASASLPQSRNVISQLPDSLESRIHSNRHYIQRDQRHMNEHFARR